MGFSTGQANPSDYIIGRGIIYFASVNSSGFPLEFRDLGNAPEFSATLESEKIEHQSSRQGLKQTDKEVVVSLSASITFTLDEINFDNLALFLSGSTKEYSQAATAVVGVENMVLSTPDAARPELALGRWYDLYVRADMSTGAAYPGDATDERVYNINSSPAVAIEYDIGGTPTTLPTTDYVVDLVMGRIFIIDNAANRAAFISGGALVKNTCNVDFTPTATTMQEVQGLTASDISGALKFIQKNAADRSVQTEHQFHAVTLSAEGDLALIGDEFVQMQFSGSAESREAVDAEAPVVRSRSYADAGATS